MCHLCICFWYQKYNCLYFSCIFQMLPCIVFHSYSMTSYSWKTGATSFNNNENRKEILYISLISWEHLFATLGSVPTCTQHLLANSTKTCFYSNLSFQITHKSRQEQCVQIKLRHILSWVRAIRYVSPCLYNGSLQIERPSTGRTKMIWK